MSAPNSKPSVRPIEPIPVDYKNERLIVLRDPMRFTEKSVTISLHAYWVVTVMDGTKTVEEIKDAFNLEFNADVPVKDIENLVSMLDDAMLLNNEKFENYRNSILKDFYDNPIRPSALAGTSYPENPDEVSKQLDRFLDGHQPPVGKAPFAIVAPHIDLQVGGPAFGAAFSQLKNSKAETFVILGIGHTLAGDFFACIDKDFETPLGTSQVDLEFLKKMEERFGEPIYEEAFAHKSEHSIEFQALFLQKLFANENPGRKIAPILLSFPETINEISHPKFNGKRVNKFSEALRETIDELGEKVAVIAGIDLAHIGKRFGQIDGVPPELLQKVEAEDRKLLDYVAVGDKDGFIKLIKEINLHNHVCGFPALYMLFDILRGKEGKLLDYRQNVEGEADSMVSFAAMSF